VPNDRSDEPSWDDIFGAGAGEQRPSAAPEHHAPAPTSGVAAAAWEEHVARTGATPVATQQVAGQRPAGPTPPSRRDSRAAEPRRRKPRRKRRWGLLVVFLAFLLAIGGVGYALWGQYGAIVMDKFGLSSTDYSGSGNGKKLDFVINSGDTGAVIARGLAKEDVTKTFTAPYKLMLADPKITFEPGSYTLQHQMSAKAALAALRDPKNRVVNKAVIVEGTSAEKAYTQLSVATKIPVAQFQAAAKDLTGLGVPAGAPSIEGFLFPATYQFDPGQDAHAVLARLTGEMTKRLDKLGVAPADRLRVVTLASIVQREAGSNADMPKIARVFQNRLDQKMLLQSDATVTYGTGHYERVSTTNAERADASNPYNTYVHQGLTPGPIGLPGEAALEAAVHPADGSWLYFVTVNLKTGETTFSTTQAEHDAAVKVLRAWCRDAANKGYCS
jgi:UPF0755 protein